MTARTSSRLRASRRASRDGPSASNPASVARASTWERSSGAARPTTSWTGSLARLPKSTGVARVTNERPGCRTAGEGREWASAMPGAMTMYGPSCSTVAIISSLYAAVVAPAAMSASPLARTAARQSPAGTPSSIASTGNSSDRLAAETLSPVVAVAHPLEADTSPRAKYGAVKVGLEGSFGPPGRGSVDGEEAPMRTFRGTPASVGLALGPAVAIRPVMPPAGGTIDGERVDAEVGRLGAALEAAGLDLDALAARVSAGGHADEAAIFAAQAAMARDPGLRAMAEGRIASAHEDAVAAVLAAARDFAEQLAGLGDELLAARAADVLDVGERGARQAAGLTEPEPVDLPGPSIVVAHDLAPSVTATLPRERLLALVLEAGSATAHAAILARAFGIAAGVGVAGVVEEGERAGPTSPVTLAVDGTTGDVVLEPDETTRDRFARLAEVAQAAAERDRSERELPAVTRDGVRIALLANIGGPAAGGAKSRSRTCPSRPRRTPSSESVPCASRRNGPSSLPRSSGRPCALQ